MLKFLFTVVRLFLLFSSLKPRFLTRFSSLIFILAWTSLVSFGTGCASKKTKEDLDRDALSGLSGKKVAITDIEGESTARRVFETSLINQILKHGNFELIPKKSVEVAKVDPTLVPGDLLAVAKKAGADFALSAKIQKFEALDEEGVSEEQIDDPVLAEERGDGQDKRFYKVRRMTASILVEFKTTDLGSGKSHLFLIEDHHALTEEAKTQAIHMPPKLRYLEERMNTAVEKFFGQLSNP